MKFSANTKFSFGITLFTSLALILIGAMLVKYKVDPSGSLFYIIGIILASTGLITFFNYIAGRVKQVSVVDYIVSFLIIILGIMTAVFSQEVQAYGLVIIGGIFVLLAVSDFIVYVRNRNVITLIFALSRLIIGLAFILSGVSEAFISNDEFSSRVWEVIGYLSISFGILFLALDTFKGDAT